MEKRRSVSEIKIKNRILGATQGITNCGKTKWAMTGPDLVSVVDLDGGIHRVWRNFYGRKKIEVYQHRQKYFSLRANGTEDAIMKASNEQLEQLQEDWINCLKNSRTSILDGNSENYEIVRLAEFGRTEKSGKARE